jgi:thymidylate synthase
MSKADIYFKKTLRQLIDSEYTTEGQKIRPVYADGTPSHTKFLNNVIFNYDISKGEYPILTLRPLAWKSAIKEVLWIYQQQTSNLSVLRDKYNIKWWDSWNIGNDTIGRRYGATVAKYDLVNKLLKGLKEQPYTRRHIIDMYQYADFEETDGLHPCAYSTTWNVRGEYLDLILNQRSSDFCVAWGINIFQYFALQLMVAKAVGLKPGILTHVIGNVHIYDRHIEQANELVNRLPVSGKEPKLLLNTDETNFYNFTLEDFELIDFEAAGPQLKFEMAI